jgi:radical SAM protein with 4Fe4S-binding SPASM domain
MRTTHTKRKSIGNLYRRVMRLHNAIPYLLMPGGRAFPPLHYFFEVTRRCNLRCRMCQYREWFEENPGVEVAKDELTTDEWKSVIDQTGRFSLITFTGGEPWVRPDFEELLVYASAKRRTHVITNGVMLNEERVRRCVELAPKGLTGRGLIFVGTSVEGPRGVHDHIRNREGAFDDTMAAVSLMARYRAELGKRCPFIHVTAVIQEDNLDTLPELPALVAEAGADVLNLTLEIRFLNTEGLGDVDPEELCELAPDLPRLHPIRLERALKATQAAADAARIELRLPAMPQREMIRYYDGGLDLDNFNCRQAWTNLVVGARGGVFPCFIYEVGSVREAPLKELWNGPKMRAFRQRLRLDPYCICQGCCHLEYDGPTYPAWQKAKQTEPGRRHDHSDNP